MCPLHTALAVLIAFYGTPGSLGIFYVAFFCAATLRQILCGVVFAYFVVAAHDVIRRVLPSDIHVTCLAACVFVVADLLRAVLFARPELSTYSQVSLFGVLAAVFVHLAK